jgi:hypothetical protein
MGGVYSLDQRGFGDDGKPQIDATISYFTKAVEADPNYAPAHAQEYAEGLLWSSSTVRLSIKRGQ